MRRLGFTRRSYPGAEPSWPDAARPAAAAVPVLVGVFIVHRFAVVVEGWLRAILSLALYLGTIRRLGAASPTFVARSGPGLLGFAAMAIPVARQGTGAS